MFQKSVSRSLRYRTTYTGAYPAEPIELGSSGLKLSKINIFPERGFTGLRTCDVRTHARTCLLAREQAS